MSGPNFERMVPFVVHFDRLATRCFWAVSTMPGLSIKKDTIPVGTTLFMTVPNNVFLCLFVSGRLAIRSRLCLGQSRGGPIQLVKCLERHTEVNTLVRNPLESNYGLAFVFLFVSQLAPLTVPVD